MKKWISIISLLLFSFLLLPKSAWHSCEHHFDGKKEVKGDLTHVDNEDCSLCQLDFSPLDYPLTALRISITKAFHNYYNAPESAVIKFKLNVPDSRGSPISFS